MRVGQFLAVTLAVIALTNAQRTCVGQISDSFDDWCNDNCNNDPPMCPPALCSCSDDEVAFVPLTCTSLRSDIPDSFCETVCNAVNPFCPPAVCSCAGTGVDIPVSDFSISEHDRACCEGDVRYVFYSTPGAIIRQPRGGDAEVCYELDEDAHPKAFIVDDNDNLYVADPVMGTVTRMSALSCDESTVEVLASWTVDSTIPNPTALAILSDRGLLVSGPVGLYLITFNANATVSEIMDFPVPRANVAISDVVVADGNRIFLTFADAEIIVIDLDTGVRSSFLAIHELGIPDYGGLAINDCGLFFTATDSNQVFFCPDLDDSSSCALYCNPDDTLVTCTGLDQPTSISSGCCCDIYVSSPGNGNVVLYENDGSADFPLDGEVFSTGNNMTNAVYQWVFSVNDDDDCDEVCVAPAFVPSITSSHSLTASPSPSPSASFIPPAARLVWGGNIPGSGGNQNSFVVIGYMTVSLVVCPPGVESADLVNCPFDPDSLFNIPLSMLDTVSDDGETMEHNPPVFRALAKRTNSPDDTQGTCLWHTQALIRGEDGVIIPCDDACMDARSGRVRNQAVCDALSVTNLNARDRARDAMNAAITATGSSVVLDSSNLGSTTFLQTNQELCRGDVVQELSVNLFSVPFGTPIEVTISGAPRLEADRCDDDVDATAARICYDTSQGEDVHGPLKRDLVCVNQFLISEDVDTFLNGFIGNDPSLPPIEGDFADLGFKTSTQSRGCPSVISGDADAAGLCGFSTDRLCFQEEC